MEVASKCLKGVSSSNLTLLEFLIERLQYLTPAIIVVGLQQSLFPLVFRGLGAFSVSHLALLLRSDQLRQGLQFSMAAEQHVVVAGKFQRLLGEAQLGDEPGFR